MMKNDWLFSVIIPVYNSEKYIEDAIGSIVNQTIGFSENIQLILINDGSADGSEAICRKFEKQYPSNIKYIYKENGGASSARNLGLTYVEGKYLAFLDSDDLWAEDAFEKAYSFFKANDVSIIGCRMERFGFVNGEHIMNAKFKDFDMQVVDLESSPFSLQTTIGNCIIKFDAIGDQKKFVEDISMSEDTLFVNEILLDTLEYGLDSEIVYYYRKREDHTSLTDSISLRTIFDNLSVCNRLISLSQSKYGEIKRFVQSQVLYIIRWQIFKIFPVKFSKEDETKWIQSINGLLQFVDDDIICNAPWMNYKYKLQTLRFKYVDFEEKLEIREPGSIYIGDEKVVVFTNYYLFSVGNIDLKDNKLHLDGYTNFSCISKDFSLFCIDEKSGEKYEASLYRFTRYDDILITGKLVNEYYRFEFDFPIKQGTSISFYVRFNNLSDKEYQLNPAFRKYALLDRSIKSSYTVLDKYILKYAGKKLLVIPYRFRTHLISELRRTLEIIRSTKYSKNIKGNYILLRWLVFIKSIFSKKKPWLFMDKEWSAGDNAENLYRYACKTNQKDKLWFAIQKNSDYYKQVKEYGNVVEPYSFKYKIIFLRSRFMISSRTEYAVRNPFGDKRDLVKDLIHHDFVYLTHGTLFGDLSKMLNRLETNISLYAISAYCEYDNLVSDAYGYTEKEVKLLGMARYDGYNQGNTIRKIAFLPTWRSNIAGKVIPGTTERVYNENFCNTDYCKFYNSLIGNEKLLDCMRRNGYVGEFYVHPAFEKQAADFKGNEVITVGSSVANYEEVLSQSALLVTDFSGVGFDFGYQRKPIVYPHFDSIFTNDHTYGEESYFSYEDEGFGPVTYDLESTVDAIVHYIENDCALEDEYKKRADKFFPFSDYNNCQRIYDEIMKL